VLASWFLTWEGKTTEIGKIIKSGKQVALYQTCPSAVFGNPLAALAAELSYFP
jgi:hypothetical protein